MPGMGRPGAAGTGTPASASPVPNLAADVVTPRVVLEFDLVQKITHTVAVLGLRRTSLHPMLGYLEPPLGWRPGVCCCCDQVVRSRGVRATFSDSTGATWTTAAHTRANANGESCSDVLVYLAQRFASESDPGRVVYWGGVHG